MPSSKHSRSEAPQISFSSWLMGGPLVTKPRNRRLRPVLVTTEPAKSSPAETANSNDKKAETGEKEAKTLQGASKDEVKSDIAVKDSANEKKDDEWTWTPEQDTLILKLKSEKVSWKEIAARVSVAKSDVQVRFKELQRKCAETKSDNTPEKTKGKDDEPGTETKGEQVQKIGKENGGNGDRSGGRVRPDDNWSRNDCEILEMLEARYREQKWLSMQASFYNLTGRMIRADVIEQKLSEARS